MARLDENWHSFIAFLNENGESETRGSIESREKLARQIIKHYSTHTARETCKKFGIEFTDRIVKILHRAYPKQMGWGGARKNAGKPPKK